MLSKRRWRQIRSTFRGVRPGVPRPVFLYVPQIHPTADLISGRSGTPGASDTLGGTPWGRGYEVSNTATAGLDFGATAWLSALPFTALVVSNGSNAEQGALWSQREGASPFNQMDFLLNSDNAAASSAGRFSYFEFNTGGVASFGIHSNATTLVDGAYHIFGIRRAALGSGGTLWYDGASIAATTTGSESGTVIANTMETKVGGLGEFTADASFALVQSIPLCVVWDTLVSDALLTRWREPGVLLEDLLWYDLPAMVFGVTAAGGSSYNVAAAFGVTGGFTSSTASRLSAGIVLPATLGYSATNTAVQNATAAFGVTAGYTSDYTWSSHGSQSATAQYDATAGLAISSRATHNVVASISVTLGYSVAPTGKYSVSTTYPTTLDLTSSTGSTTPPSGIWTPVSGSASTWTAVTSATTTWSN